MCVQVLGVWQASTSIMIANSGYKAYVYARVPYLSMKIDTIDIQP